MNPHKTTGNTTKNNNISPKPSQSQRWLAACAHELRIPIAQIDASMMVLLDDHDDNFLEKHERQKYLEDIMAANQSLNNLVEDCIAFAKGKQTDFPVILKTVDIHTLLSQLYHSFIGQMHDGIELKFDYRSNVSTHVLGDAQRITQCAANLLRNAIKFTETGSITLQVIDADIDTLQVNVIDTGIGIAADKIHDIWDAFTKVHDASQDAIMERGKGLGLGLAIVSQFVQQMQGHVNVTSQVGVGSMFSFTLPKVTFG